MIASPAPDEHPAGTPLLSARTAALFGFLIVLAAAMFVFKVSSGMIDFDVYWRAGARAAAAEPLYRIEDGHYQFKYLPAFAVLMTPLSGVDIGHARAIWYGLSVLLLGGLVSLSARLLPQRRIGTGMLLVVTLVAMGKFYARELALGQANLLFADAAVGALLALRHGRDAPAGLLIALSIVFKPYGVVLLPWLALRRRWRAIAAATLGLGAVLLAPLPLYGAAGALALHREWWRTVVSTTAPNLFTPDNVSWLTMYARWFGVGTAATLLTGLTIAVVAALGVWMIHRGRGLPFPDGLDGALLLLTIPLLSPQGWEYVLLLATPAIMYLANYSGELPRRIWWPTLAALCVIGLTIYDVMGRDAYMRFRLQSGITLAFFVVIGAVVLLRLRRIA